MSSELPLLQEGDVSSTSSSTTANSARYEEMQSLYLSTVKLMDMCESLVNAAQFHMIVRYKAIMLMPVAALLAALFFYTVVGSSTLLTVIAIVLIPVAPLSIGILWTIREDYRFKHTISNINRWSHMHRVQETLRPWYEIQEKYNKVLQTDQASVLLNKQMTIIRKHYASFLIKIAYMVNCIDPVFMSSNTVPGFKCCCAEKDNVKDYNAAVIALPGLLSSMPSCRRYNARAIVIREAISKYLAISDGNTYGFCISDVGDVGNFELMISAITDLGFGSADQTSATKDLSSVFAFIDTIPNSKLEKGQFDTAFQMKINESLRSADV